MRVRLGRLAEAALLVTALAGCAARRTGTSIPEGDRNEISQAQMQERRFTNVYDAVQSLRSNWLQKRGTDSFSKPGQIWVYMDGTKLGGLEALRSIAVTGVAFVRHFDGASATARWGLDHGQGVIFVSSVPH